MSNTSTIVWTPSPYKKASCALTAFVLYLNEVHNARLPLFHQHSLHQWSINNTETFWHALATFTHLPLHPHPPHPPHPVDPSLPVLLRRPILPNFSLNFAEAVLRHAISYPDKPALLYATETTPIASISFSNLSHLVARIVAGMRRNHIAKGDHVAALVANTPHAVAAMLATAAIGAVWSSCSPDFGPVALISRLSQTKPRLLFYSPSYVYKGRTHHFTPNLPAILEAVPSIATVVELPAPSSPVHVNVVHYTWDSITAVEDPLLYEHLSFFDPLVTMFSSGTTGAPKCMVQGPGIILNQVKEHVLHLDITESSTVFYSTSTGWMLFNWLVACLASAATILLYDGAALPPTDPLRMVNLSKEARVTHFGSGAKYFQTLSRYASPSSPPIPTLTTVMATGSPSTHEHFLFARDYFGPVQYVSMSGGTEINGCFALGTPWKPVRIPELQCAGLGMDVAVFNDSGEQVTAESGELVCRNAAPCMPLYFIGDKSHMRYRAAYFEKFGGNVWAHGDFAEHTAYGGFVITGRSDSTLNPGGVRIGTADIYEVVEGIDGVEGALVAEQVIKGDSRMIMLLVLRDKLSLDDVMKKHIWQLLRKRLSPRHVPHSIVQVPQIPFTFSGKKCEIPVKRMLQGHKLNNREAVQNPNAFDEIRTELQRQGLLPSTNALTSAVPSCKL